MEHRDYDGRKTCGGCRYWSEMLAQAIGGGPVQAMCISDGGPLTRKYTARHQSCDAWADGYLGAVDTPGFDGTEYRDGGAA